MLNQSIIPFHFLTDSTLFYQNILPFTLKKIKKEHPFEYYATGIRTAILLVYYTCSTRSHSKDRQRGNNSVPYNTD